MDPPHEKTPSQAFDDMFWGFVREFTGFFEKNGWTLVFCFIFVVVARSKIRPYLEKLRRQKSLKEANDPRRRRILDVEAREARARQQVELEERSREAAAAAAARKQDAAKERSKKLDKKMSETFTRGASQGPGPRLGGYNPLTGEGSSSGGGGYQPSFSMRNRGGGG